jgi:hypothetical protein
VNKRKPPSRDLTRVDPRPADKAVGVPTPRDATPPGDLTGEDPRPAGKAVGVRTPRDTAPPGDPTGKDRRPAGKAGVSTPRDRAPSIVAAGPGPRWLRLGLAALAVVYLGALIHHPESRWVRPAAFFTEATSLFSKANSVVLEFRIEVWACGRDWEPIDPRPYFPIQPDDKESRFQRLGYFYFNAKSFTQRDREVARALDSYISMRHAAGIDDGVAGPIGGIRVVKIVGPFPIPGERVERYRFDPFAQAPADLRREKYATPASETRRRCASS